MPSFFLLHSLLLFSTLNFQETKNYVELFCLYCKHRGDLLYKIFYYTVIIHRYFYSEDLYHNFTIHIKDFL